mgnify:CR=1 FL=1
MKDIPSGLKAAQAAPGSVRSAVYPSLAGKRVLVSGGGSGIGAGLVEVDVWSLLSQAAPKAEKAMDIAAIDGRVVVVGVCIVDDVTFPYTGLNKELDVRYALYYERADFTDTIDVLAAHGLILDGFVEGTISLDDTPAAFATSAFHLLFLRYTINSDMEAGVMPEMREACPRVSGRCLFSFCCTSFDKPRTVR